jgi:hypothetical protein
VDNGSDLVVMRYLQFDCNCDLHDDKGTNILRRWNAKEMIKERKAGALCAASKEQRRAEQTGGRQKQAASGVLPKDSAAKPSGAEQFHERSAGPAERCPLRSKPERSEQRAFSSLRKAQRRVLQAMRGSEDRPGKVWNKKRKRNGAKQFHERSGEKLAFCVLSAAAGYPRPEEVD